MATDVRNGVTTYTYYADDQVQSVATPDPDPSRSGDGYDAQTTSYAYDSAGRQNLVTQPDGGIVNTTYWPTGAVKRTWGSRTYPTEYTYDAQGRVKTLTTWQDFTGDSGKALTTWNYNLVRGWLDNKRYADNSGPAYAYKPSGRLFTRTWARNATTTYSYANSGDLAGVSYSDATPAVTMDYDRSGRPKSVSDAAGAHTLSYHASGQLADEIYSAGLLNGLSVERDYDAFNRLSSVTTANGSPIVSSGYGYDAASRLQTATQGTNTATYVYAANSSLVQTITFAQGGTTRLTTTKAYDALNRLTSISSAPSAAPVSSYTYSYNSANQRMKAVREDSTYWGYGYDALGQVTSGQKHLADDSTMLGQDFAWAYDDIGNRKTATTNNQVSTFAANLLNEYSNRTVPAVAEAFGTAAADATITVNGQAAQRQGTGWYLSLPQSNANDPVWVDMAIKGVRTGAGPGGVDAVATGTRHLWLPKSPEAYGYDADGNLTSDGRWSYTWDGENRLVAMETRSDLLPPAGRFPLSQKRRLEFAYDYQGRRISKKVFNWSPNGWVLAGSSLFLYDGWNLIAELNASSGNSAICTYSWGLDLSGSLQGAGGVGGLLFSTSTFDIGPSTAAFSYDGNGNVIGLVDMATGVKSATYDYNAFGETIQSDGVASAANHFRFSTKYTDDETGLLYYGFRYYNSSAGRWLNRDPMEESGGQNLYSTCRNNLTNFIDPYGLDTFEDVSNFVAGAGDALSFGLTRQGRKAISWMFFDGFNDSAVNTESKAYFAGEVTETAVEITVTLGGASLRQAAKYTVRAAVEGGARASFRRANKVVGGFIHHINPIKGARYPLPFRWSARGSWNMKWVPTRAAHMAEHASLLRMEAIDRARESTLLIRQAANRIALYVEGKYKCGDWAVDIKADVQGSSTQEGPTEFGMGVEASVSIEEDGGN